MALIQWNTSLSVNIAEIDTQHQRLISMINELNDAMLQGRGKDVLGKIIAGLVSYTATHFATEEKYFDRHGYPASNAHKQEHRDFTAKVSEFKQGFDEGRLGLSVSVMNFLGDWLRNHIKGSDMDYSPFLTGKGVR
ncbi:hemerythrin family protein [Syntrophotalea carbinolica DSM 2380]|uniref:Hemerythrin family protein n=1 Tax=Syntrophotalea carbinolica (strain DSM 2380 / NBRC 103641 / GraBd1) TaxID=338963 RepID=Q3A776_SYNC1|nr:bacteriohemerythrin [Syntrophotalea carbinolica]ABA87768.1 hemerythrin family protein [Syntrophotalea carbinolica DSM 2380]